MAKARRWLLLLLTAPLLCEAAANGLGDTTTPDVCAQTTEELRALLINEEQERRGVEGNTLVANTCKTLVEANIMLLRTDEEQQVLCGNDCYGRLNAKYKTLLDHDCFSSDDSDEQASASLRAAAYQIACQSREDGRYCIPLLAELVKDAGTDYNLCSDIVEKLGCCFQSYRQYMLLGTAASVAALDEAQQTCTAEGVAALDQVCPCGPDNVYNLHAFTDTAFCSLATRARVAALEASTALLAVVLGLFLAL